MDDRGGEIDVRRKALIGFVGAQGDALEFPELAEEVLDQVAPFIHLLIEGERLRSARVLGDHRLGPSFVQRGEHPVAVEGFVPDQRVKGDALDEWRDTHGVVTLTGQQDETHQVAQRIDQRQDLGRHAALGAADGLALSPPFAPCPWRCTLTIVASTIAYSRSGSSEQASNSRRKTSALTQSRYRL